MPWIYLSPHPDDVALSCGGLVWEQVHSGEEVSLWTICAGDPPPGRLSPFAESLQTRWGTGQEACADRRAEDLRSCAVLGAVARHFTIPDCIYRRSTKSRAALYDSEEAIYGNIHSEEATLVLRLGQLLAGTLDKSANVVCPIGVGGHVDHRLVRAAAEKCGCSLWYYADYPYVLKNETPASFLLQPGCQARLFPISDPALFGWAACIAEHASQINSFWPSLTAMRAGIEKYCRDQGGVRLWRF